MSKKKLTALYSLLIVLSVFPYLFYAIAMIRLKAWVLWTYSTADLNVSAIGTFFVYFKDLIAVLIFAILFQRKAKISKTTGIFCGVILYGEVILCINGTLRFSYFVAGFRALLYFMVALLYARTVVSDGDAARTIKKIRKLVVTCVFVEAGVVIAQINSMNIWKYVGTGGYRICGTFGNGGALGSFCVAAIFVLLVSSQKYELIQIEHLLTGAGCLFMAMASGSRMSMMLTGITFMALTNDYLGMVIKLKRCDRVLLLFFVAVLAVVPMYSFMIEYTARGNIMVSGSMRLDILRGFFTDNSLVQLLFGHGLGYGTNAAVNMGIEGSQILDGTFTTVFVQFGLMGLALFVYLSGKLFVCLWKRLNPIITFVAFLDYFVICITINLFEQIALNTIGITVLFILYYDLRGEIAGQLEN